MHCNVQDVQTESEKAANDNCFIDILMFKIIRCNSFTFTNKIFPPGYLVVF